MSDSRLSRRGLAQGLTTLGLASMGAAAARPAQAEPAARKGAAGPAAWAAVKAAHGRYRDLADGKNLDHPILSKVPSNYFGLVLTTPQGDTAEAGDIEPTFSIQSIGKVFTLALVLQESGAEAIEKTIGVNATGRVFNSIEAIEADRGRNLNPLVTPGAIAMTGSVEGANAEEAWARILGIQSAFAGRQLSVSEEVYKASSATNQRNRAIGMLMSAYGRFPRDPVEATDLYTRQCSIAVNAKDLAVMAATLAGGGRNPITGKQVVDARLVPGILAIMATAGLYDTSGQWLFHTGLPAKSGVGGGLIAVAPAKFGIAAFSPPLDAAGNSVRGQKAIMDISGELGGNPYAVTGR